MVMAPPVSLQWIPEDDLLLKNAVEAGASLEALARGAARFSRRYTLQELRERWHSLLYDAGVSLQASDYMFELEISGINPGSKFRPDFIRNREVRKKRKFASIRRKYYAMRKRFRSEFYGNIDIGFLEPNLVVLSGHESDFQMHVMLDGNRSDQNCILGDSVTDNFVFQEEDLDILRYAFPEAIDDVVGPSGATDLCQTGCPDSFENGPGSRIMGGYEFDKNLTSSSREGRNSILDVDINTSLPPDSEDFSSFHTMVFGPDQPPFRQWTAIQGTANSAENISSDGGKETNAAVYTGEFADPYSLLNLSDEDEMLFDFDEKTVKDKCGISDLDSVPQDLIKDSSGVSAVKEEPQVLTASVVNLAPATTADPLVLEVCAPSICEEQQAATPLPNVDHPKVDVPTKTNPDPDFCELSCSRIICVLNTEDPVIPCNDDIFLLIHPNTSFCSTETHLDTSMALDIPSCPDEKEHKTTFNLSAKTKDSTKPSSWPSEVILESLPVCQLVGQGGTEIHNSGSRALLPDSYNKKVGETNDVRSTYAIQKLSSDARVKIEVPGVNKVEGNLATVTSMMRSTEVGFPRNRFPEADDDSIESDIEDSLMDDDVPYFSDIEAMILEMDLDPYDEDSHITSEVASYQYEETKRTIIRLEQAARSCLQRTMTSQGALAILYGHHSRHYIRKTQVILGRSTEDVGVDIDLAKEGRTNKISRQQAIIKMESDGSFFMKNLGQSSMLVNGMTLVTGQFLNLCSGCLIQTKGMSFVFEINQGYVKQQLENLCMKDRGKKGNWDASPI